MRSTFMGLETSKRGVFTQQTALYTTGHNISNANTIGYSRQRVNMQATQGFPYPGLNSPNYPGHLGTGVETGSIQRIRDQFIDRQFRQETNKFGYYESRTKAINQMEDIMDEPSEFNLNAAFDQFWKSLHDVSTKPGDAAGRKVAIERANHLAQSFNYMDTQLKEIQGNLGNEIDVSTGEINSILKRIAAINQQIQEVEPSGYVPNDLYDARDVLVDELNQYIPVSIEQVKSGGLASGVAEGTLTISYKAADGTEHKLVEGREYAQLKTIGINGDSVDKKDTDNVFDRLETTGVQTAEAHKAAGPAGLPTNVMVTYDNMTQEKGKLLSLINMYGYSNDNGVTVQGYYPETMAKVNEMVNVFAQVFNKVHNAGFDLNGANGLDFFETKDGSTTFTAANIKVNEAILKDPSLLAASSAAGEEGNGKWAIELANLQSKAIKDTGFDIDLDGDSTNGVDFQYNPANGHLNGATFQSFYQGIIGKLGVDGRESADLYKTSGLQQLAIEKSRSSVSSVSLDEEMTNMITFQQAYNANARMITVVDETLDKIINGMGRVGL
ncbi:MAG: flagellar hook-associated protein FlgK [Lysinibacillus sp.]